MRKILVSLLVVSMLLGLVGTAFAGGFSDTTDSYVNKAAAYGWVGGYADGTFKPEGNITRAEAAKMIVSAMGLTAAADAAKGLAPKFTDVPASHWASGYINVCVAQSVLKGYADNTFKPEANITGAEIVTMIVRGLKRESEAIGDWPVGHVTVAAANGIIGSGFAASAIATRANVAKWLVNASGVETLTLTNSGWVASGKTWLTNKVETKTGTVSAIDATKNTITLGGVKYDLSASYIVGGGKTLANLVGYVCDAIYDKVAEKVTYVAIKTDVVVKSGTVKTFGADYFYLNGDATKYTVTLFDAVAPATDYLVLVMYRNGAMIANNNKADLTAAGLVAGKKIEFYASSTNVVSYIKSDLWVKENKVLTAVNSTTSPNTITIDGSTYYVPSTAVITLNGAAAALADIKKDVMYANVSLTPDTANVATLEVGSKTVSGKVTAIRTAVTADGPSYYVSIDSVEYLISTATPDTDQTNMKAATGAISITLDLNGEVAKWSGGSSSNPYVKIIGFEDDGYGATSYTKWIVDVKGVSTTYLADDDDSIVWDNTIAAGDYVKLTINSAGIITAVKELTLGNIDTISSVYTGASDSQITMATAVDPDGVGADFAATTVFYAPTAAVTYVNDVYSTSALAKDQKVKYALDVIASAPGVTASCKVAVVYRDTVVEYSAGKVISEADNKLQGFAKAVENSATVNFYADVLHATQLTPTAVGGDGVVAGNELTVDADGSFTVTLSGTCTTVYAVIEDAYGNTLDVTWTVDR